MEILMLSATLGASFATAWSVQRIILIVILKAINPFPESSPRD
jgi:hypothetical protein